MDLSGDSYLTCGMDLPATGISGAEFAIGGGATKNRAETLF